MLELVREQTRVLSIASKILSEVEGKLNSRHREFYLRQQLKAIRSELGEEVRCSIFVLNCVRGPSEGRGAACIVFVDPIYLASCLCPEQTGQMGVDRISPLSQQQPLSA